MAGEELHDLKVAILVENGFEQIELTDPKSALERAGAATEIISPRVDQVKGWNRDRWGDDFTVDRQVEDAGPHDYDALLLPGGVMNPDKLRMNEAAVRFVKAFFDAGKPVAAICHGPQVLIEGDVVAGRRMTSYRSIRTDLENAGANWVDEECVVDDNLVTSRSPDDLPAFNRAMIEVFSHAQAGRRM